MVEHKGHRQEFRQGAQATNTGNLTTERGKTHRLNIQYKELIN